MPVVSSHKLQRLSRALLKVYAPDNTEALPRLFADACAEVIDCANASCNRIGYGSDSIAVQRSRGVKVPREEETPLLRNLHEHLPIRGILRDRSKQPSQLSDFYSRDRFHRTDLYNEYYRRSDTQEQMCFPVAWLRDSCVIMAVNHVSGGSFSEQDRLCGRLLREHLENAWRLTERLARWRELGETLIHAQDAVRMAGIVLDRDGRAISLSKLARALLDRHVAEPIALASGLPPCMAAWTTQRLAALAAPDNYAQKLAPLVLTSAHGTLEIELRAGGDALLPMLLLSEQRAPRERLRRHGLTPREAEVLHWIGEGKTNPEIALILGAAPRTIHKHTENIFRKLGVDNRHAAMRIALEV
jgi:DNA-binding CsgD family transcriptional regulator